MTNLTCFDESAQFTLDDLRRLEAIFDEPWQIVEKPDTQLDDGDRWARVVARIRLNATGEIRYFDCDAILSPGEDHPSEFIWSEGNYSCDCNRKHFFNVSAGIKEYRAPKCSCGLYSVQLINPMNGRIYYDEFNES
jgi:hypothetical protein